MSGKSSLLLQLLSNLEEMVNGPPFKRVIYTYLDKEQEDFIDKLKRQCPIVETYVGLQDISLTKADGPILYVIDDLSTEAFEVLKHINLTCHEFTFS